MQKALPRRDTTVSFANKDRLMAMRELVTGSDVCTPSDGGAGPSNALSSFTNSLLGQSSKQQERLREVRSAVSHACL